MARPKPEALKHNLESRLVTLLNVAQGMRIREGMKTHHSAMKGLYACPEKLVLSNGRMVAYIYCDHGLEPGLQYCVNQQTIFRKKVSGFIPDSFLQLKDITYSHTCSITQKTDVDVNPNSFLYFCRQLNLYPDVIELNPVLEVLSKYFTDCRVWYLGNVVKDNHPIGIHVTGPGFEICLYCMPHDDIGLTIETVANSRN